ncbi:hypothetical protein TSUD_186940 [Trifolium subterraneum]|uniref:Uncharacterized protein n=1 Tax=Trifolium subterraneum TaxID=3900 RepID=A0A2Z6PRU6_TRISU|nr:hypothetical protein TSUD_186940 [Trifolium subterraneum]
MVFINLQFGRRWFKAEEASNLRAKIHKLLVAELHNSIKPNNITASSPSSAANATECVETAKDSSTKDSSIEDDGVMSCDSEIIEKVDGILV